MDDECSLRCNVRKGIRPLGLIKIIYFVDRFENRVSFNKLITWLVACLKKIDQ